MKIILLLAGTVLVAGVPEPNPDPDTDVNVEVGSDSSKFNAYLDIVKDAAGTSINLVSGFFGSLMGDKCCYDYEGKKYDNGAMDVKCDPTIYPAGTLGKCVDGNVQCEYDALTTKDE